MVEMDAGWVSIPGKGGWITSTLLQHVCMLTQMVSCTGSAFSEIWELEKKEVSVLVFYVFAEVIIPVQI